MTRNEALELILKELQRAEGIHPLFPPLRPNDPVYACAIINEEAGELTQAVNNFVMEGKGSMNDIRKEAVQTGAMALRFLMEIC